MTWIFEHRYIILFLIFYTAILAYHAYQGKRKTHNLADYYVGGRSMGGALIGLSFFATYSSTNSFVGFSGQAYSYGLPWLLLVPFVVIFTFLAWKLIAPRLSVFTKSLDSLTIPDFIGFRFESEVARTAAAVIILFASFFYMTAIFKGIGNLLVMFLEIPYTLAIILVFFVVTLYTAVGGFISVVKTDAVQAIILVFAAVLLFIGTVNASGGLDTFYAVRDQVQGSTLFSWNAAMPFPFLVGILVASTMKFMVEPRQLSRFYALENKKAMRTGMWVSVLTFVFVYTLLLPIGIFARNIFPEGISDSDFVVPALLSDNTIFHPSVSAFLLMAMVAAAMSSLDSVLLVMASTCERDIVGLHRKKESEISSINATRIYLAIFCLVTALIALNPPGGIVMLTALSGAIYAACFFPAIIFGLYWRRGNGISVLASFAAGIICLIFWGFLPVGSVIHQIFPAIFFSTLTYVIVTLFTGNNNTPTVENLFK